MNHLIVKTCLLSITLSSLIVAKTQVLKTQVKPIVATEKMNLDVSDLTAIIKGLKQQNTSATNAAAQLKTRYKSTAQNCYKVLVAAGYLAIESGTATSITYALDAANTFKTFPTAIEMGRFVSNDNINLRFQITKATFTTLTFEQLIDISNTVIQEKDRLLLELCKVLSLSNQEIISKGFALHNSRILSLGNSAYSTYPNLNNIYNIIKLSIRPNTSHFQLYAMLINGGFNALDVANSIPMGELSANGQAKDNISAACLLQNTQQNIGALFEIEIIVNTDGSFNMPAKKNCFKLFAEKMKEFSLSRQNLITVLKSKIKCLSIGSSLCEAAKNTFVNSILTEANYPR